MKKYLVSFTQPDGTAFTETVDAISAIMAIRIAHQHWTEGYSLNETVAIVCTLQE